MKQRDQQIALANSVFMNASNEDKRSFLRSKLRLSDGTIPTVFNKHVGGEKSFGVSRDVWQADIFRRFVLGCRHNEVALEAVSDWMLLRYAISPEFVNSEKIALWKYFSFLGELGFVRHLGRQRFQVLKDIAPWLEDSVKICGCWFWTTNAYSCSLNELEEANIRGCFGLGSGILSTIQSRFYIEHSNGGHPEDVACSVTQRIGISPVVVLDLLAEAGVTCNPREDLQKSPRLPFTARLRHGAT